LEYIPIGFFSFGTLIVNKSKGFLSNSYKPGFYQKPGLIFSAKFLFIDQHKSRQPWQLI